MVRLITMNLQHVSALAVVSAVMNATCVVSTDNGNGLPGCLTGPAGRRAGTDPPSQ